MSQSPKSVAEPVKRHTPTRFPWRRIAIFILIFSVIVLSANAFVWATLGHFFAVEHWVLGQAISAVVVWGLVPATIFGRNHSGLVLRSLYGVSATAMGVLNYCFFAAFACWAGAAVIALFHLPVSEYEVAAVCFGLGVVVAIAGVINAGWIRTTSITVALDHLPESWRNRTAALVTDIHLGHIAGPFYLRRVIAHLRRLNPDIVFVSGDMFDGTTAGIDHLAQPWAEFSAPLGIWFVTGNHDEFEDRHIYLDALTKVGVRVLNNEKVIVDGLQLLGVHDHEAGYAESYRATLQRMQIDRGLPSILLNHQPAHLQVAADAGVSLQLSGHTHSGQFWPWNLVVKRVWRQFAYGLNRLGNLQVYTSSGAGAWGPPLRVGTHSEIVLICFEIARCAKRI